MNTPVTIANFTLQFESDKNVVLDAIRCIATAAHAAEKAPALGMLSDHDLTELFDDDDDDDSRSITSSQSGEQPAPPIGVSARTHSSAAAKRPVSMATGPMTKEERRRLVVKEILETERDYVRDLHLLDQYYIRPIVDQGFLSSDEFRSIFSNVQQIANVNQELLDCLTVKQLSVGASFLKIADFLKMYTVFCTSRDHYQIAFDRVCRERPKFVQFIRDRRLEVKDLRGLDLGSFLIKPVQRICKYPLLLQELIRQTEESHPERPSLLEALSKVNSVAEYVNERSRDVASREQVNEIQSFIENGDDLKLVDPARRLVRQDTFMEWSKGAWKARQFVLFNDCLLILRFKNRGLFSNGYVYELRERLPVAELTVQLPIESDEALAGCIELGSKRRTTRLVVPMMKGDVEKEQKCALEWLADVQKLKEAIACQTERPSDSLAVPDKRKRALSAIFSFAKQEKEKQEALGSSSPVSIRASIKPGDPAAPPTDLAAGHTALDPATLNAARRQRQISVGYTKRPGAPDSPAPTPSVSVSVTSPEPEEKPALSSRGRSGLFGSSGNRAAEASPMRSPTEESGPGSGSGLGAVFGSRRKQSFTDQSFPKPQIDSKKPLRVQLHASLKDPRDYVSVLLLASSTAETLLAAVCESVNKATDKPLQPGDLELQLSTTTPESYAVVSADMIEQIHQHCEEPTFKLRVLLHRPLPSPRSTPAEAVEGAPTPSMSLRTSAPTIALDGVVDTPSTPKSPPRIEPISEAPSSASAPDRPPPVVPDIAIVSSPEASTASAVVGLAAPSQSEPQGQQAAPEKFEETASASSSSQQPAKPEAPSSESAAALSSPAENPASSPAEPSVLPSEALPPPVAVSRTEPPIEQAPSPVLSPSPIVASTSASTQDSPIAPSPVPAPAVAPTPSPAPGSNPPSAGSTPPSRTESIGSIPAPVERNTSSPTERPTSPAIESPAPPDSVRGRREAFQRQLSSSSMSATRVAPAPRAPLPAQPVRGTSPAPRGISFFGLKK
eukprot:TRINITY_DN3226_c0_g1_i1.p1 TRINITY_DN3226_c0_g1~~TRINITY_DN3226_c0_g1_i1.p1  ORF type:complete len:1093 (-),score=213.52 TRINITY_DN3226_c0_g1_i1:21-3056(-)